MRLLGGTLKIVGYKTIKVELTNLDLHPSDYIGKKAKRSEEANRVVKREKVKVPILETIPANKHLYLLRPAYEWMISTDAPWWYTKGLAFKTRDWRKLTPDERLAAHVKNITDANGALSYEYEVLED